MTSLAASQVRTKVITITQKVVVADQSIQRITNNIYVQWSPADPKPKSNSRNKTFTGSATQISKVWADELEILLFRLVKRVV